MQWLWHFKKFQCTANETQLQNSLLANFSLSSWLNCISVSQTIKIENTKITVHFVFCNQKFFKRRLAKAQTICISLIARIFKNVTCVKQTCCTACFQLQSKITFTFQIQATFSHFRFKCAFSYTIQFVNANKFGNFNSSFEHQHFKTRSVFRCNSTPFLKNTETSFKIHQHTNERKMAKTRRGEASILPTKILTSIKPLWTHTKSQCKITKTDSSLQHHVLQNKSLVTSQNSN